MQMRQQRLSLALVLLVTATATRTWSDSFTLDANSWTRSQIGAQTSDVLIDSPPGTPGLPTLGIHHTALGLSPDDQIDALSDGLDDTGSDGTARDQLFSVQPESQGLTGSGVEAEYAQDTPPGLSPGHASDLFHWDQTLAVPNNSLAPAPRGWRAGTRDGDEANVWLANNPVSPDNVSAVDRATLVDDTTPSDAPGFEVYFSLAPGSPKLHELTACPDDVLAVGGVFGGQTVVFVEGHQLGLPPSTYPDCLCDIDALSLEVHNDMAASGQLPEVVVARFSLAPLQQFHPETCLLGNSSGGDLLMYDGFLSTTHRAEDALALDIDDDVDALESFDPDVDEAVSPGTGNGGDPADPTAVPEPARWVLLLGGIGFLGVLAQLQSRRRQEPS